MSHRSADFLEQLLENGATGKHVSTDLSLGEAFCIFIFFHFLDSVRLPVLNGLHFYFWWRAIKNRKY